MIKVVVNRGQVDIKEANGNGLILMSELCCMVKAVCMAYNEDEDETAKKEMTRKMILTVASALVHGEETERGADIEDDENADF